MRRRLIRDFVFQSLLGAKRIAVHIRFDDFTEAFPAFMTIIMMPLTYSIAQGLAFGFMSYTVVKFVSGKHHDNNAVTYVLTALFILHFVVG